MPRVKPDAFLARCPSRPLLARVGDKWTMLVLVALARGDTRFGELRRRLEGISQKSLTQALRNLERDGLVERTVFTGRPLRVDYALTERGASLILIVEAMKRWAEQNLKDVERTNARFDTKARERA